MAHFRLPEAFCEGRLTGVYIASRCGCAAGDAAWESGRASITSRLPMTEQPRLHCTIGHTPLEKTASKFCTAGSALTVVICLNGHEVKPAPILQRVRGTSPNPKVPR
jgi:hypothetical protein